VKGLPLQVGVAITGAAMATVDVLGRQVQQI